MDMIAIMPERKAQLDDCARRHGRMLPPRLMMLSPRISNELADYQEAVEGIREGYEDVKAGRIQSADEAFEGNIVLYWLPMLNMSAPR
jgi:predicted transcriptional regulator